MRAGLPILLGCAVVLGVGSAAGSERPPTLPGANAAVEIPAQEWPLRPGPRTVRVTIHYPGGKLAGVKEGTGLMLSLHNWGGTGCAGTARPQELADRLNVVALCVDYLQSGPRDGVQGPEPYDFGYLQALDALRALQFVQAELGRLRRPFAKRRIYATGGSGGGNVSLMAWKFAPRTFACIVDLCGMAKLSDDIAFRLPGGSPLDARYSRDPNSPHHLSLDHQELRFVGNPDHLEVVGKVTRTKIVVVHGVDDATCPAADAREMVAWMRRAGIDVEPRWIGRKDLDGKVFTSSGHALGDRTAIVFQVAGKYLTPGSPTLATTKGPNDFERRGDLRFPTSGGAFVISYASGFPVGRFEPAPRPGRYPDPTDLGKVRDPKGNLRPLRDMQDWQVRREHLVANLKEVLGPLPSPLHRVPLEVQVIEERRVGDLLRRKISFRSDPHGRVPAYLFVPAKIPEKKLPAVLCLHQTTAAGKAEPAGLSGDPNLHYALELARRGYVALAPDYPSFGEHRFDFAAQTGYASGSMKAVWDNIRAVDVLETLPYVDPGRIGVLGHSLGGHNAMFTAVFDERLRAIVSSCGFTGLRHDDLPSWTGPRYLPRIRTRFGTDVAQVPFDFHEIVAAFAPRAFLACAPEQDADFAVAGVREVLRAAAEIYRLHGVPDRLEAFHPPGPHAFPQEARRRAYDFLDRHLKK